MNTQPSSQAVPNVIRFVRTTKGSIPFEALFPGSLFRIHAEVSRGLNYSRDNTIWRKALSHEGFYAYDSANPSRCIVLYPEDRVVALRVSR